MKMSSSMLKKRKTIENIKQKKSPIICLTAYTKPIAQIVDDFADIILVGDSVGPVLYGYKTTREVSIDIMINHGKAVVSSTNKAFIVIDMPFGTYEYSKEKAFKNAKKIIDETGANAIKLEGGGKKIAETVKYLVSKNILVVGHLGGLPQSIKEGESFKIYGRTDKEKKQINKNLTLLEDAGVLAIVIESTIGSLAKQISEKSKIPTIGIGASSFCSGQILVTEDIIGLSNFDAKFLKKFCDLNKIIRNAVKLFADDVRKKKYPQTFHEYK